LSSSVCKFQSVAAAGDLNVSCDGQISVDALLTDEAVRSGEAVIRAELWHHGRVNA
jgi:hypothetical protein